jgi:branched-chain amino acid transport system substrate-binding protein
VIHDMYLAKVRSPKQSAKPWDYYEILATTPADEAFKPLKDGNCPLATK